MARKPAKWPSYALNSLEGTLLQLKTIQKLSREAQTAAMNGEAMKAVAINGDIRNEALLAISLLVQARTGEYEDTGT
jgi:shikimate kinase